MAHQKDELNQDRIHLVSAEDSQPASLAEVSAPNNRIEMGEYIADILIDKRSYPVVVHWIVQRRGCPEILQWGHEDTFEAASREAVSWIDSLLRYDEYRKQHHNR